MVLAPGTEVHRVHDERFAPASFNPNTGSSLSRFAPVRRLGAPVPTLYAATSFECAVHETVFHDVSHDAPDRTIPFSRLAPLRHSILAASEELVLATLFEPDLNAWGISRRDLIDTLPDRYAETARWAEAIHAAQPDIDGLVWTSRRCDPDGSMVFFGDRASQFSVISSERIVERAARMSAIVSFARRAGIVITL